MFSLLLLALALASIRPFSYNEEARHIQRYSTLYKAHAKKALQNDVAIVPHAHNVRMPDGVKLFTISWTPNVEKTRKLTTIYTRSPYGVAGTENWIALFAPYDKFALVMQNVRGTGESGGNFSFWHDGYEDGHATMEWIAAQPWSNGKVFQVGASADGINALLDVRHEQKRLSSMWLIWTTGALFDVAYPNGAYRKHLVHDWLGLIHRDRPDAPAYEPTAIDHESFSAFWREVDLPVTNYTHCENRDSVFNSGWWDIFLALTIRTFEGFDRVRGANHTTKLIIGARGHCQGFHPMADLAGYYALALGYENALRAFGAVTEDEYALHALAPKLDRITMFVLGPLAWPDPKKKTTTTDYRGNYWTTVPAFPPAQSTTTRYYMNFDTRALDTRPPSSSASVSFVYDPRDLTPTECGNRLFASCGPCAQNKNEQRADNVVFTTSTFASDVAVCGYINVSVTMMTNCTDTDFVVRVTDVWPNKNSTLLMDGDQRVRWRHYHAQHPTLVTPNQPFDLSLELWPVCYVMNAGHALRVTVTSSDFDRFSANPNNGRLMKDGGPLFTAKNTILKGVVDVPFSPLSVLPSNVWH